MDELGTRDPIEQVLEVAEFGGRIYTGDPSFWRPMMQAHWLAKGAINQSRSIPESWPCGIGRSKPGVRAGRLIAEADPEFVARHLVICFYGVWCCGFRENLDGEGFRFHVLYGFVLAMLGVAIRGPGQADETSARTAARVAQAGRWAGAGRRSFKRMAIYPIANKRSGGPRKKPVCAAPKQIEGGPQ